MQLNILPPLLTPLKFIKTFCAFSILASPNIANAESWTRQQEYYNDKSRLELELFRQGEELESLKQQRQKKGYSPPAQQVTPKKHNTPPTLEQMDTWQYQQDQKMLVEKMDDLERQMKYQAQRAENERASIDTGLILENRYYADAYDNLKTKLGFDQRASNEVVEALKANTYRHARAAQKGDAKAQEEIGDIYYDGMGVKQDYAEAAKWFYKAAVQNNSSAQYKLAMMYSNGEGVPVDMDYAVLLLRRAASLGHAEAIAVFENARKDVPDTANENR